MFKTGMQLRDKRQIFFNLNVLKKKNEKQGHFVERKNTKIRYRNIFKKSNIIDRHFFYTSLYEIQKFRLYLIYM